ncbi:DUF7010 family protein [Penaeicola halotolerans]|uniref:DUF7010 family protein n=1 Tax=Penaeicola halotolerans TaxID=2793196 RepID=UPI001CF8496D|nr:hypothetical protein [Penaeicola halotolerans]
METKDFDYLRDELSLRAKNGLDFTLAASVVWALIAIIWTIDEADAYDKSVLTFIVGGILLPLAFTFSKVLKTNWKVKNNPLQPLGLWLNFAQLFYFPFLFFCLLRYPQYFLMAYAIITGAHFFPYAWYYRTAWYAVFAGIVSFGALMIGYQAFTGEQFVIGIFTSACLALLSIFLYVDFNRRKQRWYL